jgi:hypothetical protein
LLAVAVLVAVAFMASVLLDDPLWRTVKQLVGLATALVTAISLVLNVRRWGADDDFWWPGADR